MRRTQYPVLKRHAAVPMAAAADVEEIGRCIEDAVAEVLRCPLDSAPWTNLRAACALVMDKDELPLVMQRTALKLIKLHNDARRAFSRLNAKRTLRAMMAVMRLQPLLRACEHLDAGIESAEEPSAIVTAVHCFLSAVETASRMRQPSLPHFQQQLARLRRRYRADQLILHTVYATARWCNREHLFALMRPDAEERRLEVLKRFFALIVGRARDEGPHYALTALRCALYMAVPAERVGAPPDGTAARYYEALARQVRAAMLRALPTDEAVPTPQAVIDDMLAAAARPVVLPPEQAAAAPLSATSTRGACVVPMDDPPRALSLIHI